MHRARTRVCCTAILATLHGTHARTHTHTHTCTRTHTHRERTPNIPGEYKMMLRLKGRRAHPHMCVIPNTVYAGMPAYPCKHERPEWHGHHPAHSVTCPNCPCTAVSCPCIAASCPCTAVFCPCTAVSYCRQSGQPSAAAST